MTEEAPDYITGERLTVGDITDSVGRGRESLYRRRIESLEAALVKTWERFDPDRIAWWCGVCSGPRGALPVEHTPDCLIPQILR